MYSVRCYCNEDKCNEGEKCHCDAPPPPTFPTSAKPSTTQPPNGLKCQVCTGDDGICSSLEDLGESQTCLEGEVCAFMIAEEGGRILYARNCAEDINQDCLLDHPEEGVTVTGCFCSTDNCNTMQECECKTSTVEPDHGLKCQVCSEDENGGCFNLEDLGESKTCAEGEICSFFIIEDEGRVMYERKCFESTNEDCLLEHPEEGVTVTGCFCNTDNCNTIQECDCKSSTTTSKTSTQEPDNGLKCQVCSGDDGECSNLEDTGESKTCPEGQVCAFIIQDYEGTKTYLRSCHEDLGQDCLIDSQEGVSIKKKIP